MPLSCFPDGHRVANNGDVIQEPQFQECGSVCVLRLFYLLDLCVDYLSVWSAKVHSMQVYIIISSTLSSVRQRFSVS